MNKLRFKIWLRAMRAPFFQAAIVPTVLGTAIAWYHTGIFYWYYFLLAAVGAAFINAGTNLINDYFDHHSTSDDVNTDTTPFSGGSRMIQENLISPEKIYWSSLIFFGLAVVIGSYLTFARGFFVLAIGAAGVFLGYSYTAPPLKAGYHGWGELLVGISCGPLVVAGAYYVQAQTVSLKAIFMSIPVGLLIAAVLYINEFPDYRFDKQAAKNNLIVRMGRKKARKGLYLLISGAYVSVAVGVVLNLAPWPVLLSLSTLPLAWRIMKIVHKEYANTERLVPAMSGTVVTHLVTGLLLSLGYVLARAYL